MFSILLAAVLVANPIVERGEPARLSPQVEFAHGDTLRSYSFFAYVHGLPAAFVKMNADKVKANGRDPYWRSIPIAPSKWTTSLPESIELDCRDWPVGDYRVTLQCHVKDKDGKDRYRPHAFSFSIRERRKAGGIGNAECKMENGGGTLPGGADFAIPLLEGLRGDPAGAAAADVPWQTGFVRVKSDKPATGSTRFKVFHDGDWLYVAVDCEEPENAARLSALQRRNHDNVMIAREECIEINLSPGVAGDTFYKIVVRPTGDVADYLCVDDNTGNEAYVCDAKWQSGATAKTAVSERGWTAEVAIPVGPLYKGVADACQKGGAKGDFVGLFSIGRTRLPGKRAEWSIWPASAKGFCYPKSFAKAAVLGIDPLRHAWELNLNSADTAPAAGALAVTAKATAVNRTGDYRLAEARAYLVDVNGKTVASGAAPASGMPSDRLQPVSITLGGAKKGLATLHFELYSAEGRLEAQTISEVVVEYEPIKIVLAKPCYRDCVFDSMKLNEIEGVVILEEGVGRPLAVTLSGEGTDEKVEFATAAATNSFRFPFAGKAKGDYFIRAGGAVKRVRNLPFQDGEIWIDEDGAMRRNGEKFMPFGWFSDQYTEDYPGLTIAQMYDGHVRDVQFMRKQCDRAGALKRGFVASPAITEPDGRKLFDTKALQGPFTAGQRESIRRFAEAVKDHPWFCAYYLCDEPEGRDLNAEWFKQEREFLAEIDPYHPTMMLNYSIEGTIRYSIAGAEVNCPDAYPYYFTDGTTRAPRRVTYDKAKAASTHAQCAWLAPQLFDWPTKEPGKVACGPGFDEIREQALLAFAGDARGLLWYSRYSYGGAFTEHMRHGPRLLLEELLETRDVFLAPTREGELRATSTGPDKTLVAALKRFGGETLVIAVNTSDREVAATFRGAGLPSKMHPNGVAAAIPVAGGKFTDVLKKFEAKVYYDRAKKFDLAAARKYVYGLEAGRRKPGNLAAAPRILTFGEVRDIGAKAMPDGWWPRIVASSSQRQYMDLPFTYFLQDGLVDEWPIVPYLAWSPRKQDKSPWVRVEFGAKKKFSRVVLHRCRDEEGRVALMSGRVVADGRELATFGPGGCKVVLSFPEAESEAVTVEIGETNPLAKSCLLSELEVIASEAKRESP